MLQATEDTYRRHHAERRPPGFIFCGPERLPLFRSWVGGPGLNILDLGCRDGALTSAYLHGNRIVGVDIDRHALARAEQCGIEPVWADLDQPLPFAPGSFDVVVVAEVLEHLRFPEQALAEARRVLRPNGRLVGSVPNNYRLKSRLRFLLGRPPENDPTLIRLFSAAEIERLLSDWTNVDIRCVAGRLARLHSGWFGNDIVFRAEVRAWNEEPAQPQLLHRGAEPRSPSK